MATDAKIKSAFKIKRPGELTRKAKAEGLGIHEFARRHQHDGNLTGTQSRFYLNVLHRVNARGR